MSKDTASKICKALTGKSKPCTNPVKEGTEFCGVHKNKHKPPNWLSTEEREKVFNNLQRKKVDMSKVWLDPENPRITNKKKVPDSEIPNKDIQDHCTKQIDAFSNDDLNEKLTSLGFRTDGDALYVRKLDGEDGWLVLEGNRRVRMVKEILNDISIGIYDKEKSEGWKESFNEAYCLEYTGDNPFASQIIQSHRHLGGGKTKNWQQIRRAEHYRLIRRNAVRAGHNEPGPSDIAHQVGEPDSSVVRSLLDSLDAMKAANDILPTTKKFVDQKGFGWFEEGIMPVSRLKKYLGWDKVDRKFEEEDRVKSLAGMINKKVDAQITNSSKFRDAANKDLFEKDGTPTDEWEKMVSDSSYKMDDAVADIKAEKKQANAKKKAEKKSAVGWIKKLQTTISDVKSLPTAGKGGFKSAKATTFAKGIEILGELKEVAEDQAGTLNQLNPHVKAQKQQDIQPPTCKAMTGKSKPCTNPVKEGTEFCGVHKGKHKSNEN